MKTLFINGKIYPMNMTDESYSYMGIEKDKIIYLSNEMPKDKYDKIISIENKYIYPTFTDSHLHLLHSLVLAASSFYICNIENDKVVPGDIKGIENKIKEYVLKNKKQDLIIVNQYITPAIKENRLPSKTELDSWTDNKDIVIFSIDGHSASLSSSLLSKLSIESETGILSGENYDMNQGKITGYIAKKVSLFTLLKGIVNFTNDCYRNGISKVCALDGEDNGTLNDSLLSLLVFFSSKMDIKVRLFPEYHNYKILDKYKNKMKAKRIGGCSKWELDGSIGSHSAAFIYPFKDTNTKSNLYYKEEYVKEKIKEALENDITFTAHAIGTCAIDEIVNGYKENKDLIKNIGPYNRIDHFEFPSKEAIDFVSNNRIAITFQSGYSYIDKRHIHSYTRYLNEDNLSYIAPLKEMVNKNILVLGSSDSPVQSINPFSQMVGMTNYYIESESISNYEALKTYTTNPSLALDEEEGRLVLNKNASFIITDSDIINKNMNELNNTIIASMYIDGKKVTFKKANLLYLLKLIFRKGKKI